MARDFSGTSQYGTFTGPSMSGDTTIACWFWGDTWDVDADDFGVCGLFAPKGQWGSDAAGDVRLTIIKTGIATQSSLHFQVHTSGGDADSSYQLAGNSVTTGAWHHVIGEYIEGSANQLYLDGTVHGTVTPSGTLSNRSTGGAVGAYPNNETGTEFNGRIAECAVWNRTLDDAEKAALAAGYSPMFFKRGLVFYLPLYGKSSPEPELIGKLEATITGATEIDSPRVIRPSRLPAAVGHAPIVGPRPFVPMLQDRQNRTIPVAPLRGPNLDTAVNDRLILAPAVVPYINQERDLHYPPLRRRRTLDLNYFFQSPLLITPPNSRRQRSNFDGGMNQPTMSGGMVG